MPNLESTDEIIFAMAMATEALQLPDNINWPLSRLLNKFNPQGRISRDNLSSLTSSLIILLNNQLKQSYPLETDTSLVAYNTLTELVRYKVDLQEDTPRVIPKLNCNLILRILWLLKACAKLKAEQEGSANDANSLSLSSSPPQLTELKIPDIDSDAYMAPDEMPDFAFPEEMSLLGLLKSKDPTSAALKKSLLFFGLLIGSILFTLVAASFIGLRKKNAETQTSDFDGICATQNDTATLLPLLFSCDNTNQTLLACCGVMLEALCLQQFNETLSTFVEDCQNSQIISTVLFSLAGAFFVGASGVLVAITYKEMAGHHWASIENQEALLGTPVLQDNPTRKRWLSLFDLLNPLQPSPPKGKETAFREEASPRSPSAWTAGY